MQSVNNFPAEQQVSGVIHQDAFSDEMYKELKSPPEVFCLLQVLEKLKLLEA